MVLNAMTSFIYNEANQTLLDILSNSIQFLVKCMGAVMKKMDVVDNRKTRYTRKALFESLIELMKSKSITHITIKEICDIADISRSTFYTYYDDQYDLLKCMEEETASYIEDTFKRFDKTITMNELAQIIEDMLRYINCNNNSIQVLLSENGDIDFQKRFFQRLSYLQQTTDYFTESLGCGPEMLKYYSAYVVNGSIALVQCWLKNDMDVPIPEIAKMLINLSPVVNKAGCRTSRDNGKNGKNAVDKG
ncbi:MAG: TetR/AcrR family transcriptional regulator [Spirochaetaceae bacterium]|jgi:AcrR family transcriptional regulator|nr:TetR/AcrR family transcriptional regulator [Spirochaetaceae bacterium]